MNINKVRDKFIAKSKYYGYDTFTGKLFKSPDEVIAFTKAKYKKMYGALELAAPNKDGAMTVEVRHKKFITVCPFRLCPDVSAIDLNFKPGKYIIELAALRNYMDCYSGIAITHESVYMILLKVIKSECRPKKITLSVDASPFLGMDVVIKK